MRRPVASSSIFCRTPSRQDGATVMLHFSVPLAADIADGVGDENGGVTVTGATNAEVVGDGGER